MKSKPFFLIIFLTIVSSSSFAQVKPQAQTAASQTAQNNARRIIYDVSVADTSQQAGLMRQLNNVKRGWPDAQIEVVVHGKGLDMVLTGKAYKAAAIKELQAKGVVFAACQNTMRFRKVTAAELLPGVKTVPMAIGEIVTKQQAGWGYIKF